MASLFINEEEKRIILEILEDLKRTNELENCDIGIITGYSGQKDILRKSVKANGYDKVAQIDINTLDAFQGRENDIIIYSTVRTKDSIGFQKEKERVNVAFSRAKKLLIICGDIDCFYNYDDPNNKFIEIIFDASNYQLLDKVIADDNKLKPIIPIGEVKCFIEKFKEISEIFDEENKIVFSEGVHPIKEELLKIDKVDNTFVKFVKIPIHVYVSSNGLDIDVLAARTKMV